MSPTSQSTKLISGTNWIGLYTLAKKEIQRFLSVHMQTITAPVVNALLFCAIFTLAFNSTGDDSGARTVGDIPFLNFVAPGLIIMAMAQNAFANTSSSIGIAKIQNVLDDILMAPLSPFEVLTGFTIGAVARGMVVGLATATAMLVLFVPLELHSLLWIFAFGLMGCLMLAFMGLMAGIWAEKFDHLAFVTNFIVTPLTFLSGTFYSIQRLPDILITIAHLNPFFYMIDGFRYGFLGISDSSPWLGLAVLAGVNIVLAIASHRMLKSGYKIKS